MGTWSTDAFGNDDAMMWVDELLRHDSPLDFIKETLACVEPPDPDAIHSRRAIAAAEFIAFQRGHQAKSIPEELRVGNDQIDFATAAIAKQAATKLRQIMRKSELLDLWEEDRKNWLAACRRTIERLSRPIKTEKKSAGNRKPKTFKAIRQNEVIKLLRKNGWFIMFENRKPDVVGPDSVCPQFSENLFEAVAKLNSLRRVCLMDASFFCKTPMDPSWI